ncbi:Arylsulfatase [Thalassoglobus neptunius]|uniref:Arylsulfatase n=1 Tax=Thalassoglobus neptunius TaxID=1938619 RepID=A0A5C5W843_9PLAN|nr:arylsulfatase [Thalassoglobus neptunius]TWT46355.1 Arylsulfatase [Thalassoglobus neptunius]
MMPLSRGDTIFRTRTSVLTLVSVALLQPSLFAQSDGVEETRAAESTTHDYPERVLPFSPTPIESITRPRLQDSKMKWPEEVKHLPDDAPNILIILIDDIGFGVAETFGGEVHTPTLTKLANEGIRYNSFHTTSICSPTRAALLTGRNHTRVGSGTIAERAVAFDGYTGVIPKTAATIAEVLKAYGYSTSAFGKWHNTPAVETTSMGPKDRWPNGYGFEHFYGFLGGETSQWEPRLTENYDHIEPPEDDPEYHLTTDLVDRALSWLDDHQSFSPDKPFLMYWAPGAVHGPHHIFQEWADKYAGKFDDGWDAYRERVYRRQLEMGIIPSNTQLTERDETLAAWDSLPESEKPFQLRLMELFAGFVEHTDFEVGRLVTGLEERGLRDNTLIFFIVGDNGSSAEGQGGSISELLAQNNIPNTIEQQLSALEELGGIDVLGSPKTENMYHAGWAWAGGTPFKGTKLLGAYFGGTRNPLVVSWPKRISPSKEIRQQFHHVIDIAPTIYELLDITPPEIVNGYEQISMDGISLAYTFDTPDAVGRKKVQYFDNNGSRAIYSDGWMACTFGPFIPWDTAQSARTLPEWDSAQDEWELYDLRNDFSQANNLAEEQPSRLAALKQEFKRVAEENQGFPIGAGNWLRFHPEDRIKTSYSTWTFSNTTRRMPEFTAPGIGRVSTKVTVDATIPSSANGVLYAVGGAGGGLTIYLDEGHLVYEYNMLLIDRFRFRSADPLTEGTHQIVVSTQISEPGGEGTVELFVDNESIGTLSLDQTVPVAFSATETFDVGIDLGSPVSTTYADRRPFPFDGTIDKVTVELK